MALKAKQKGTRVEYKIVKLLEKEGIYSRRQPMSGALFGLPHDVVVRIPQMGDLNIEVKARAGGTGFKTIARWIGSADLLMLVEDGEEPKVVMSWRTFKKFLDVAKISDDMLNSTKEET